MVQIHLRRCSGYSKEGSEWFCSIDSTKFCATIHHPPLYFSLKMHGANHLPELEPKDQQWAKRVAQLERHMRMNKLGSHMTVTEELGKPQSEWDEVKSTKEAKRLAFDIFWNARSDYSR